MTPRPALTEIKIRLRRSPLARYAARRYRLRWNQPDWRHIARPLADVPAGSSRVLIATSIGGHLAGTRLESTIAVALRARGVNIDVLLCDSDLPACMECELARMGGAGEMVRHGPTRRLCPGCFESGERLFRQLGVNVLRYGDFLLPEHRAEAAELARTIPADEIPSFRLDGLAVGEHATAGALRFFARASLDEEPGAEAVLRRYLNAAILTARAAQGAFRATGYLAAVFHHGIYVPQGILGEVARDLRVRVINWTPAYRSKTFIFSHGDTYHHTLMHEDPDAWNNLQWSDALDAQLMDYLKSRWTGDRDWIVFHEESQQDITAIAAECGIDFSRPCIGMLTNVMWDAQLHYPANAFRNMREWCIDTIRYFAARPELQLLIRVHPAEKRGGIPSRQMIVDEIAKDFPCLPDNVAVVGPESPISTYAAMAHCNAVIIYGTKTGIELAAIGKPVIVAGEAWSRNKGFTFDASSRDDYFGMLDCLPFTEPLSEQKRLLAKKYAFHFFFRRMIPLGMMTATKGSPPYQVDIRSLDEVRPGRSVGLDIVCDGILTGSPFIYPAEVVSSPDGS